MNAQPTRARVLAIDDEPMNLDLLERSLQRKYAVMTAADPESALDLLRAHSDVAIILCDYRMPAMNGAKLLAEASRINPDAKRVIITGYADVDNIIEAVNTGKIHYVIRKPWNHRDLDRVVDQLIRVNRLERENRHLLEQLRSTNEALRDKERLLARNLDDRSRDLLAANDELDRINRELEIQSYKDTLTGLYNHRAFRERLDEELSRARRYRQPLSLLIGNVDRLREINNELGYQLGDEILRQVAQAFSAPGNRGTRDSDVTARYSGEDFAVLLPETDGSGALVKADRLRQAVAESSFPNDLAISLTFGLATFPDDAETTDDLVAQAKNALRAAKDRGGDQTAACEPAQKVEGDDWPAAEREITSEQEAARNYGPLSSDIDSGHDFPSYHEHLLGIAEVLERDRAVSCLYIDLSPLRRIELEFGIAKHNEVFSLAGRIIDEMRGDKLRNEDTVFRTIESDAYLCFLSASRTGALQNAPEELEMLAKRVREQVELGLARIVQDLIHDYPRVHVGYARVLNNSMVRPQRLIARLVKEAADSAVLMAERNALRDKTMLQEIILQSSLTSVYQPIVNLESGNVFGFEALTRGPRGTAMESPKALFGIADEVGLTFELDRACFHNALRGAAGIEPVHRLFVNLLPLSFYDTSFIEKEVSKLLDAAAITPANVVFEITEKLAIENFASFRRALGVYTSMGFGVAIDDVGTRHSNLETVMSLRPNFIKVSDVLTRGVSTSTVKREMFRSLGNIASAIDAVVVAEGIETPDDLAVLHDLGVHYAQGFFLARPSPPFARLRPSVKRAIVALGKVPRNATAAEPANFDVEDEPYADTPAEAAMPLGSEVLANGSGAHPMRLAVGTSTSEAPTQRVRPPKVDAGNGVTDSDDALHSTTTAATTADSFDFDDELTH